MQIIKAYIQDGDMTCTYHCKLSEDNYFETQVQQNINNSWLKHAVKFKGIGSNRIEGFY